MECHACGATISDKAADCPHCGTSVSSPAGDPDALHDHEDAATDPEDRADDDSLDDGPDSDTGLDLDGRPTEERSDSDSLSTEERSDSDSLSTDPGRAESQRAGNEGLGGGSLNQPAGASEEATSDVGTDAGDADRNGRTDGQRTESALAGGFDPEELVSGLPLFPGAAAGFAVAAVGFGLAVAVASVLPGDRATFATSATVFFDLHFGTTGHLTPAVYGVFEVVRPPDAALGFLYLLPAALLYTAAKAVVTFNTDASTPLPESVLAGTTVVLGYLPVVVVGFLIAPTGTNGVTTAVGALVAALVYPLVFGSLGGLVAGSLSGTERRVSTVYAVGALFLVLVVTFVASFLFVINPSPEFDALSRLFVTAFAVMGATVLTLGEGSATSTLPFVLAAGTFAAAGFVRSWRASPPSVPRGFAKAAAMAPTYAVVTGLFASVLSVFADDFVGGQFGVGPVASGYVDGVVAAALGGIGPYVTAVLLGTVVYVLAVAGGAGAVAAAIRSGRGEDADKEL